MRGCAILWLVIGLQTIFWGRFPVGAAVHWDIIVDTDTCNYAMAYDEYSTMTSPHKIQMSSTARRIVRLVRLMFRRNASSWLAPVCNVVQHEEISSESILSIFHRFRVSMLASHPEKWKREGKHFKWSDYTLQHITPQALPPCTYSVLYCCPALSN